MEWILMYWQIGSHAIWIKRCTEPKQHGIKDPRGGIPYILQYTAVWVKTRGTSVVKDGQTVEKPTVTG